MTEDRLQDHPQRYALTNELHARPFPELTAPCRAVVLAVKQPLNAANRDPEADRAHLRDLLDRHGATHPPPGGNHFSGRLGRHWLKWERHTEFVTYTIYAEGVADAPFTGSVFSTFPRDWLDRAPGKVLTSVLVRVEPVDDVAAITKEDLNRVQGWFVPESLAMSQVVDQQAVVASDFRIDPAGHVRFAALVERGIGQRRLGRIVQRLVEIETYKSISMLTLPVARQVSGRVAELDGEMSALVAGMAAGQGGESQTLDRLLAMSAEIEALSSSSAFRFGAVEAYGAIVQQRIEVLREERIQGRQTFEEFMLRRFDPAMRTCRSAKNRLDELSQRATRAATLLRTRVEVNIAAQNRTLLESMDRRAALQLRLQETVEGLSVVAISYYAVSLAGYVITPVADRVGVDKTVLQALLAFPVIAAVWWMVRSIRRRVARRS
ncbi:MAG: DUF3422 domain-containing protein [Pseudomonadota bacterium]